jgi:hypothetical protein
MHQLDQGAQRGEFRQSVQYRRGQIEHAQPKGHGPVGRGGAARMARQGGLCWLIQCKTSKAFSSGWVDAPDGPNRIGSRSRK